MIRHFSYCMLSVLLNLISSFALASTKGISVDVSLYPVGSFTVTSSVLEGHLTQLGDKNSFTGTELKVPVTSLKSGITLRDEHMRERMRHKNNPYVLVKDIKAKNGKGRANVSIGGILAPVDFTYKKLSGSQMKSYLEVSFPLDLTTYKIEDINYKGIGVEDEVSIKAIVPFR